MLPLKPFNDYIRQNSLFSPDQRILLAVSGGKDSVLMAHFFKQSGIDFGIAHCNFGLRGAESQRDEHFVRGLAALMEVPVFVTDFETKSYASAHQISTQMAARELRYRWFEEIRLANGFDYIAVAHHQGDVVETVLLNLIRGTGIAGLHGILSKRDFLIRPMLFLSRSGIDELIDKYAIDFVEDSSNLSGNYARNKLRLDVIPRLRELNPNLEQTFEQNIGRFAAAEIVLQQRVAQLRSEICEIQNDEIRISLEKIRELHPQAFLLFEILKEYNFRESVTEEIAEALNKQSGTSFYSATHRVTIDRADLLITKIPVENTRLLQVHRTDTDIYLGDRQIHISWVEGADFDNNVNKAFVDTEKLIFPLVLRTWYKGDRFMPLGMKRYKNLSDFFIDQKVPLPQKEHIPILVNGNGDIVWVAGLRQDNRYKVTATTKKVAIFEQKFN